MMPMAPDPSAEVVHSFTDFQLGALCLFSGESGSLKTSCAVQVAVDLLRTTTHCVLYVDVSRKMKVSSSYRLLGDLNPDETSRLMVVRDNKDWHDLAWLVKLLNENDIRMIVIDPLSCLFGLVHPKNRSRDLRILCERLRMLCLSKNILCILTAGCYVDKTRVISPLGGKAFLSEVDFVCVLTRCALTGIGDSRGAYKSVMRINHAFELAVEVDQSTGAIFCKCGEC